MEEIEKVTEILEAAGIGHEVKQGLYGRTVYVKDEDGVPRAKVSTVDPLASVPAGRPLFVEGRATVDEAVALFVPRTCRYRVTGNVVRGGVSWDCMGLECDQCGYAIMSFEPPKVCPQCKARVVR